MFHDLSIKIANKCISRNWITAERKQWCVYALETKIQAALLFCLIFMIAAFAGMLYQSIIYSCILYLLRKRFGGWHAPTAWLCQVISVAIVLAVVFFIAPKIMKLSLIKLWILKVVAFLFALLLKPVYPQKAHFSNGVIYANQRRKNILLFLVLTVQTCTFKRYSEILVYCMLAIYTGIISVLIEYTQQHLYERKDQCEND